MRRVLGLLAILLASPAVAQTLVTSPGPASVSVTVYRAPDRSADDAVDLDDPEGFALVTETRTIALPAGDAVIRFEGVAGNILPESAIVSGFPDGVREKNLDADLLSPRTLYDRALGRRVILRRTDPVTGKVIEQQATIRSSADGAAVLQLAGGYEGLRCSGLPETLVHPSVPEGLSARPTLSIATRSARATIATVTLSYLAGGFDWQADYVVTLRPDGRGADLFAWITLASSDVTSFADAGAQVVAGKLERVEESPDFGDFKGGGLSLKCWETRAAYASAPPPPPPPPPPAAAPPPPEMMARAMDIVVTGARMAKQEELGDLKLYRIPARTTIAAKAQKQVAMIDRAGVPMRLVYATRVFRDEAIETRPVLRVANRTANGLGLPLPAGKVAVFADGGGRPVLVGDSALEDKAVDEEVEVKLDESPGVSADVEQIGKSGKSGKLARLALVVTNANPWPVAYEARFEPSGQKFIPSTRLARKDGRPIWTTTVPANGTARLGYTLRDME